MERERKRERERERERERVRVIVMFIYCSHAALSEVIVAVRREAQGSTMQIREQQSANFVGPTMTNLGISTWISSHGGMVSFLLAWISLVPKSTPSFSNVACNFERARGQG